MGPRVEATTGVEVLVAILGKRETRVMVKRQ